MKVSDWKYIEDIENILDRYHDGDLDANDALLQIKEVIGECNED